MTSPKSSARASEIEKWEGEGGSQVLAVARAYPLERFDESEQRVLAFLGASVLSLWEGLPEDFRQAALREEAAQKAYDSELVRSRLVCLLREVGEKNG